MANQVTPEQEQMARILYPYAYERNIIARAPGFQFVHYTTADAAKKILQSGEVWMRKSSCMSDFSEVQYGLERLRRTYANTDTGKRLQICLNKLFPELTREIEALFNEWIPHFQIDTYFTCVSEHDAKEDGFGRLSMWRAYDQGVGVALVLNNSPFVYPADGFGAYSSPVAYLDDHDFESQFNRVVANIEAGADFLKDRGRDTIKASVFHMLRSATLCTKHPGFAEEKEWRIIYSPTLEKSNYIKTNVEVVNCVPQPVCKIPLKDFPEIGLFASPAKLLDHIIIGPSQFPLVLAEAFQQLLREAGVSEPEKKIRVSDIPIRR